MELPSLLGAPYLPPALRVGDRTTCLVRDCEVIVTSWTDAPISWPRCRAVHQRGGSGLLVTEELERAIRVESAKSLMAWWDVSAGVAWRWRLAFGVGGHAATPGSKQAITEAARLGARAVKEREFSEQEREVRRANTLRLGLARHLRENPPPGAWTAEELALLASEKTNEEVAIATGRTPNAVRIKRQRRGSS